MKEPKKTKMLEGENVIREAGGGPIKFKCLAFGGRIFVTNKRIIHEGIKKVTTIDLSEIVKCEKSKFWDIAFFPISFILPIRKCLKLFRRNGDSISFNVTDKDGFEVAINTAMKAV